MDRTELKKTIFLLTAALLAFAVLFHVPLIQITEAFIGQPITGTPFGGRVTVIDCPCSGNRLLQVGPPKGGSFILGPGSTIFANGGVSSGDYVVGLASGGGVCLVFRSRGCGIIGSGPVVSIIGSS